MHRFIARLAVTGLLAAAAPLGLLSTNASAAPIAPAASTGSMVSTAAADPACLETVVVLHGYGTPTITCARPVAAGGHVTPDTNMTSCANTARKVDIYDVNGHDTCFTGTGYLGYSINNVWSINSIDWGWVRMYQGGSGWFETLYGDGKWRYYGNGTQITQVCIEC
jgi:hypothetical protein